MANIAGQMVTKSVFVNDGRPRTVTFDTDVSGQVIRRRESDNNYSQGDPSAMWYRFAGRQMGMITNNGGWEGSYAASVAQRQAAPATTAPGAFANGATVGKQEEQFSSNLEVINSYSQGSVAGSYVVRSGDSLQGIAQNLWGDSGLWYKLAEANGISGAASLFEGQTLRLPAGVMRNTYNASSVTPYNPAETLGDVTPSTPQAVPPKKQKCGVFGQILLVIIAVVVTLYLGPEFTQAFAKFLPQAAASFAGWGSAAAAASIVSQSVGVATGIQDKFSWKEVGAAFITGGVAGPGQKAKSLMEAVIQGAKNSAISQGINVTLGLQDKFSWAAVAAAGVGSGVGYKVGNMVGARPLMGQGSSRDWGNIGRNLVASGASAIASAAARSLVEGSDFKNNLRAAWPGAIGGTIAAAIAGEMGIDVVAKPKQEDPGDGVGTVEPIKLPPGNPIDFPKASFANLSILSDLNLNPAMKVAELRAKAAKIYGVSVDSSDLIVAEDPLPEAGISAKNSYPLLVFNKATNLMAGTLNFSNVGDAGPLNIRSFSIRGPGDATAIRIITTQSGAVIYDGGDVSFDSIGLRVSYEPIVASATTRSVPTPTLADQRAEYRRNYMQSSAETGALLGQFLVEQIPGAGTLFAAEEFGRSPNFVNGFTLATSLFPAAGVIKGLAKSRKTFDVAWKVAENGADDTARYEKYWANLATKSGSLSNRSARAFYLSEEARIPSLLDSSLPLEGQARQAFEMRNSLRTQSRDLMSDRRLAESLSRTDPNMTWNQVVGKYSNRYSGDALWNKTIGSSQSSRTSVNQSLGF